MTLAAAFTATLFRLLVTLFGRGIVAGVAVRLGSRFSGVGAKAVGPDGRVVGVAAGGGQSRPFLGGVFRVKDLSVFDVASEILTERKGW